MFIALLNPARAVVRSRAASTTAITPPSSAIIATKFLRRFLVYTAAASTFAALTCAIAFEGAHIYVEKLSLAPDTRPEARQGEWDAEADDWTGGAAGGTDPALGFVTRHIVRSAWMAQHWGTGRQSHARHPTSDAHRSVDTRFLLARAFILRALADARARDPPLPSADALVLRDGALLEYLGERADLQAAAAQYARLLDAPRTSGAGSARVATRLGDLSARLGETADARRWWTRAVHCAHGVPPEARPPSSLPPSPLAQRTLCAALLSLSLSYAAAAELKQAAQIQQSALALLDAPTTAPAAGGPLHALFLAHRRALFSMHLAETTYALHPKRAAEAFAMLQAAANASERVARALTDAPPQGYTHALAAPAAALLRDARRSAAAAWYVAGLLQDDARALECFERAAEWAGGPATPAPGVLDGEWREINASLAAARARFPQ